MKQYRSFTRKIFKYLSEKRAPCKKGSFTFVTIIASALFFFLQEATAQRVPLNTPVLMPPAPLRKDTNPLTPLIYHNNDTRFISGVVLDTTGAPLPGTTLRLLPTSEPLGTIAGMEGEFTLEVPSSYTKDSLALRISLVGFFTQVHSLSQFQKNDHIEICMAIDHRRIGCGPIVPTKQENTHRIKQDLINKPTPIK